MRGDESRQNPFADGVPAHSYERGFGAESFRGQAQRRYRFWLRNVVPAQGDVCASPRRSGSNPCQPATQFWSCVFNNLQGRVIFSIELSRLQRRPVGMYNGLLNRWLN